ncbi:class I lanthipeptide [Flavobacterium amniphilum]|uniref:class I lanthipeptide n=1 Tax=Flavobacterium amniphilum TaxID=1834035 RepID=UPI00202AACBE|nr:class I lanthipeptide [Flavobacterium amniphilum]MCL9807402.1 class I lanthipeptide [Flavobacterium amniphilum]
MKKQNNNKLAFNKAVVTELNSSEMNVVGGAIPTTSTIGPMTVITIMTTGCSFCISSSNGNFTQNEL